MYATTSTLSTVQHKDNPDAVDKMVTDLEKQYVFSTDWLFNFM